MNHENRLRYTFNVLRAFLHHLDEREVAGEETFEHKGQLIKTAGMLRDEIGEGDVPMVPIDTDEFFGLIEDEAGAELERRAWIEWTGEELSKSGGIDERD